MPQRGNLTAEQLNGYPDDDTLFLAGKVNTDGSNQWLAPAGTGGGGGGTSTGMGTVFTPPPTSGWTNRNHSAGTSITYSSVSAMLHIEDSASLNWRLITRPVSGDFELVAFLRSFQFQRDSQDCGLYVTDGTKYMGIEYLTQAADYIWRVEKLNSVTSDNSTAARFSGTNPTFNAPCMGGSWVRIKRLSGTLYFDLGLDGATWTNLFSEAVGTFLTPTDVGFGGISVTNNAAQFVDVACLSWTGVS